MPIFKIFGHDKNDQKGEELRRKIDEGVLMVYQPGDAGTVLVPSNCRVCRSEPEDYQYLEIIITDDSDKEKIIAILKELHLGLDVIFIKHHTDGFISADEMT